MPKLILYSLFFLEFIIAILIASAFPIIPELQFTLCWVIWLVLTNWTSKLAIFEKVNA